ncbi:restriction endonuclease subunit S [Lysinibacillus fusiformis]|uniref:restriction endonuclease subunit S n=1 Tax=Lysinibacillus fusiformis TaxID=28031 RepID=UPI003D033708
MSKYSLYPEYVQTRVEWIPELPKGWKIGGLTKFLDNIIDYRGKTPEKVEEGIFLVTARNIKQGQINYDLSHEYIKEDDYEEVMRRGKPKIGDVLFTTEAPLGEVANIDREDIALAQRVIKFRALPEMLDNYYLKYWILSHPFQSNLRTFATGSTAEGIKASKLSSLQVILPTLTEQRKIVRFLDEKISEINILVENKNNLIILLEQQLQSIITEAVTKGLNPNVKMKNSAVEWIGEIPEHWEVNKIKFKFDIRKVIQPTENPTVLSLTQRGLKIKDLKDFSGQHAESYDKYQKVEIKDYVMNGMDLLTGYVDCSPFEGVTSPDYRVFRIKDNTECHDYYLRYFQICYFAKIFYGHGQGVSNFGRWRLQTDVFKDFPIPVPPKVEQFEISEYLKAKENEIDKALDLIRLDIEKLKEYRQALIYEAVTGKIDVRELALD